MAAENDPVVDVVIQGREEARLEIRPLYRERPLSALLARAGIVLNTRCGQKGLCRGCEVVRADGAPVKSCQVPSEEFAGERIRIPDKSLLQETLSVAVDFQPRCGFDLRPVCGDGTEGYGLCIDIGTTTVVLALVELEDGRIAGRSSGYNAQVRIGEDVLTRIEACAEAGRVAEAQDLLLNGTLALLWDELSTRTGLSLDAVAAVTVAGNTTMLHLLVGEDPTAMGKVPFRPAFTEMKALRASDLPWKEGPFSDREDLTLYLLPGYAAYVGADIAAGWLASGMADAPGTTLLLDIGTNGEILLQHEGKLTGCATAAGPAFEGTQLTWGTRAIPGAVSRLHGGLGQGDSLTVETVGNRRGRAAGFCGSAYLDFMALGMEAGLLMPNGRFDTEAAAAAGIALGATEFGRCWYLHPEDPEGPSINEADIALLLQAKAAIAAGMEILLKQAGVRHENVNTLFLAGGFGLNIGIESAVRCGLLAGFLPEQVEVVGNTSLGGAYVGLLDRERLGQLTRSTADARIIELNEDPDFEDTFIDHLILEAPD